MVAFYKNKAFLKEFRVKELLKKAVCRRKCHDFPTLLHEG